MLSRSFVYHSLVRLRVAVGGDGPQIWRVPANSLHKQLRTADKGRLRDLGLGAYHLTLTWRKIVVAFFNLAMQMSR